MIVFLLLLTGTVHADELIAPIKQGAPAPFDGIVYNNEANTALAAKLQFSQDRCQVQIDEATTLKDAKSSLDVAIAKIHEDACEEHYKLMFDSKQAEIDQRDALLAKVTAPKIKAAPFAGGVVVGVAASLAIAYGYSQIEEHAQH